MNPTRLQIREEGNWAEGAGGRLEWADLIKKSFKTTVPALLARKATTEALICAVMYMNILSLLDVWWHKQTSWTSKRWKKKSSNFSNMQRATHTLLLSALLCIEQDRYCTMMPHWLCNQGNVNGQISCWSVKRKRFRFYIKQNGQAVVHQNSPWKAEMNNFHVCTLSGFLCCINKYHREDLEILQILTLKQEYSNAWLKRWSPVAWH